MTHHYSKPVETLITAKSPSNGLLTRARAVIVGSGYGGSVAALRLAGAPSAKTHEYPHDVIVLERGREYALGEFPSDFTDLPRQVSIRRDYHCSGNEADDALFDIRIGEGVDALVGSGLGGTSLINANVAIKPEAEFFKQSPWPKELQRDAQGLDEAFAHVSEWLDVATPEKRAALSSLKKAKALRHFADALGLETEPAPLTVALERRTNRAGIVQEQCTGCGNCVTGCNVGAKNTLAMNLIPAAVACGAKFFTGAVVHCVEPIADGVRWRVHLKPACGKTRARVWEDLYIECDSVVLAAGTFGSTEILARSQKLGYIRCSSQLGRHFSTNGDGIAMSFGEETPVAGVGDPNYLSPQDASGPTITTIARGQSPKFLLEDGAIPAPLVEIIGEIATTAAQFGRFGYNRLPAWFKTHAGKRADPLAVQRGALANSQTLLTMGDDGARGSLQFKLEDGEPSDGGRLLLSWPQVGASTLAHEIDSLFAGQDREPGLNGGQYVSNPLWRLLPESAHSVMLNTFTAGRRLTVHPLGGCRMADSGAEGVVDHRGQVFAGDTNDMVPGLYVLDGSIMPCALGVNPFLTIAALSWRACEPLVAEDFEVKARQIPALIRQPAARRLPPPPARVSGDADIIVREQLIVTLDCESPCRAQIEAAIPGADRWFEKGGLILRIATHRGSTDVAMSGVGTAVVDVSLYANPYSPDDIHKWQLYGIKASELTDRQLIARGTGRMTLIQAAPPKDDAEMLERRAAALAAFRERRGDPSWLDFIDHWELVKDRKPRGFRKVAAARAFLAVAEMQTTFRQFDYDLEVTLEQTRQRVEIKGKKVLAWTTKRPRLWNAFRHLDLDFTFIDLACRTCGAAYVDMEYLVGDGLLSVAPKTNTPFAILNCVGYLARLVRGAIETNFWEFGAPPYPKQAIETRPELPESIGRHRKIATHELEVDSHLHRALYPLKLRLHQYGASGTRGTALLIHGLAQGSLIFAHESLNGGLAGYLLDRDYDVWLLDYRLSNQFDREAVPYDGWSVDEIGALDVPAAVRFVYERSQRPIHVFTHCIGAAGTTMAVLDGKMSSREIASIVINALHPWVLASPMNEVRAIAGVAVRDFVDDAWLNPIIGKRGSVDPVLALLDRIGHGIARIAEIKTDEHPCDDSELTNAICDRMTFLYGRMWRHENVRAIHPHWKDIVGRAPGSVYRHLQHIVTWERIVDREGADRYLTAANLQRWAGIRTLFMHGNESLVFNPQSATRSAIRLQAALASESPATPVRLRRIAGFGHMDPILADSAPDESFRYVDHFFRGAFDTSNECVTSDGALALDTFEPDDDPKPLPMRAAAAGPFMRAARIENDQLVIRYWVEMPADADWKLEPLTLLAQPPLSSSNVLVADVEPACRWIDAVYEPSRAFPYSWSARLRQLAAGTLRDCAFLVGSCWYPGMAFDRVHSDQSFRGLRSLLEGGEPCDALFLIGDQIYADAMGGVVDTTMSRDHYVDRYCAAFRRSAAAQVFRNIPTHFAIDDHEIADDFAGSVSTHPASDAARKAAINTGLLSTSQLRIAKRAARSYLGSGRGHGDLWYSLDHGREFLCPAFIADTRSERTRASQHDTFHLMSSAQLDALLDWLTQLKREGNTQPKFIFTGSVVAPVERCNLGHSLWMRDDGLAGYPADLTTIVRHIVEHEIERVVFVSGDLHLSCTAELVLRRCSDSKEVRAAQIVASALYAPFKFANTRACDVDFGAPATIALDGYAIDYVPTLLTDIPAHFVKVAAEPGDADWTLSVTAYDPDANAVARKILVL